jgi:hypothetical protein
MLRAHQVPSRRTKCISGRQLKLKFHDTDNSTRLASVLLVHFSPFILSLSGCRSAPKACAHSVMSPNSGNDGIVLLRMRVILAMPFAFTGGPSAAASQGPNGILHNMYVSMRPAPASGLFSPDVGMGLH